MNFENSDFHSFKTQLLETIQHQYPNYTEEGQIKLFDIFEKIEDLKKHYPKLGLAEILEILIDKNEDLLGGNNSFNFYPSDKMTSCRTLCIGIATKKFGYDRVNGTNRTGFKGLIKSLIEYWFSCGDINKNTILLTEDWDEKNFEKEWKDIIDSYKAKGKVIFIIQPFPNGSAYTWYPKM